MSPKESSPSRALAAILPLIASNQPYEAHQKARTFASRYVKAGQYDTAIEVLFQTARELLKSGQQGSGIDLGCLLIDAYSGQGAEVGEETRGRLTQLIALTGSAGNWRKTLIDKSVSWTMNVGWYPPGDPDLQHYVGELLYKEGDFEAAEPHLIAAGKRDSARLLATMMFEWSRGGADPGAYACRGTLPHLLTKNILAARTFLAHFMSLLHSARPTFASEQIPLGDSDEVSITTDVTLNFLQLLIRTCQRAHGTSPEHQREARNAWVRLTGRYQNMGGLVGSPLTRQTVMTLGAEYFNIQPPRQPGNPLADMMSSLFGGGAPGAPAGRGRGRGISPAAGGLD